jgi:GNAT superfamily N-acetyltransferase
VKITATTAVPEQRPAGYPHEEERALVLADGRLVRIRPVLPTDVGALQRAIEQADAETLRRRFLGGGAPRSERELRRLVEVDYHRRFALAAFDEQGEGVGIARYEGERTWPVVDVAVAVDRSWRGAGLGTELVRQVVLRAARQGATAVSADFYGDNLRVQQLLSDAGLPEERRIDHGVVTDLIDLRSLVDADIPDCRPGARRQGEDAP